MISNLSEKFTDSLLKKKHISEEERELYIYGFYIMLSYLTYFVLAFIFGIVFGCVFESIVFYISFQFIRRFAGGYHAATETRCQIISTLSIIGAIATIRLSIIYAIDNSLIVLTLFSSFLIFFLNPLDTPEKPLTANEIRYFRKKTRAILIVIVVAIIIAYYYNIHLVFAPCCISLLLEGMLLITGKIKKSLISP